MPETNVVGEAYFYQIKEFLVERRKENGVSTQSKIKVKKRCNIVAKYLMLFDGLLYILEHLKMI